MEPQLHTTIQSPTLLLVQKQGSAARALGRFLTGYYREVLVAETPEAAEALLDEERVATDVVCGQDFGPGRPLGQDLLAGWRRQHPGIRRAVLATGAEGVPDNIEGVDGIYQKPAPLSQLLHLLGVCSLDSSAA
ncbi:MAG TPA: hypothetical protein VN764_01795 [Polyangiaceae bacterium]|nr:hypothetical protein [Polyangiaceae bacterium]